MWFNNILIYEYELNEQVDFTEALQEHHLKPCPPHARFVYGWMPVQEQNLIQEVAGASLLCLGKEERILPRSVLNRFLAEKVSTIEDQQGRVVKRSEKAQMLEDLEFELLPKAFCAQKRLPAMLDTLNKRLIINSSSENQAAQLIGLLKKTMPAMQLRPLNIQDNLSSLFSGWIIDPLSIPAPFQLASDCLLYSLADEKKRVSCKGYELPAEEIAALLTEGLAAAELSLIWSERIQFTLTQELVLKRVKCLDYLTDEYHHIKDLEGEALQRDAELTLMSGELRQLIDALLKALVKNPSSQLEQRSLETV